MSKNFVTKAQLKERYKDLLHQRNVKIELLEKMLVENDYAMEQVRDLVDAILARVIEKYGSDGRIEIEQPDVTSLNNIITERKDGVYVIRFATEEELALEESDGTEEPVRD